MTVHAPPAKDGSGYSDSELLIMRAIVGNCAALGVAPNEANRMAVRSILNLRRVQNTR
jgi:hypothetical protein